jgi:imidazolonepropionase-like amidohydrolase
MRTCFAAVALVATAVWRQDTRELIAGSELTVLRGATLLDGTGGPPLANSVIVLQGKQVLRVGRAGDFRYARNVSIQELVGRYITPGFVDMHVHPRVGAEEATMRMLLAFGITTVRIPGVGFDSPDDLGLRLRTKISRGELIGPRVFAGGKIIEGPRKTFANDVEVRSADEMRAEVRRQALLGVDLVKLYWSTPIEFIRAAVDEAHSHGIQVVGHLRATSWTQAAEAGIDGLVHSAADGASWELVPPERLATLQALRPREFYTRLAELIDLSSPRFDSLVAALVRHSVTVDPTLVIMQSLYYGDDVRILDRLEPRIAPPSVLATWGPGWQTANPVLQRNQETRDLPYGKALFAKAVQTVHEFHRRGVRLAAGTDVGMPWITPGVSFHRELELLVQAGIPASDVLVIATRNGAAGLKAQDTFGTIAPGMSADLVILRSDPTKNIQNTRSIEAVYKEGRRFNPRTLMSQLR